MRQPKAKTPAARSVAANGELIRQLRESKCLTQEAFAALANVSITTIKNAEGGIPIDKPTLQLIAKSFGEPYEDKPHLLFAQKTVPPADTTGPSASLGDAPRSSSPGIQLICERTKDGFLLKFQGEIRIQTEEPEKSPQVLAFLDFLKMTLPENADIKLLSIGATAVVFGIAYDQANADAISQLRSSPRPRPSRSEWKSKENSFKNNPLDDPAYWWLAEDDRQAYDKQLKARHDVPVSPHPRVRDNNPTTSYCAYYQDVTDWLRDLASNKGPSMWPYGLGVSLSEKEIRQKYPWAFVEATDGNAPVSNP